MMSAQASDQGSADRDKGESGKPCRRVDCSKPKLAGKEADD